MILGEDQDSVLALDNGNLDQTTAFLAVEAKDTGIDVDVNNKGDGQMKITSQYAWIPNFVMKHMAQELNVRNRLACQRVCDKHKTCRSFSYRSKDKLCVWSIQAIHYHYDWNFYTKVREMDAFGHLKHNGKYRKFDGVMYQEPGYSSYKGKTVQRCKKLCDTDARCKAFSYHESGERCLLTDAGIHYDPAFQYFEKPNVKPNISLTELADAQERVHAQEKSAKIAKKDRILASMREREQKVARANRELRLKKVRRETALKHKYKERAEKKLSAEKRKEKSDKRLARMKAAYNEGYFKAKGVSYEKNKKEKSIKALRKKEIDDKKKRISTAEKSKKEKAKKEKAKKTEERETKKDLLDTREKLEKLKNNEIKTEIAKEDQVLDITKNLALTQADFHEDVKDQNKAKLNQKLDTWTMRTKELKVKAQASEKATKSGKSKLKTFQRAALGKAKGKAKKTGKAKKGKAKGKAQGTRKGKSKINVTALGKVKGLMKKLRWSRSKKGKIRI